MKKIIELGLGGQLNREDNVTEKLDGQNIMISFKDGKLELMITARIHNPNKRSFTVKGAKFDILLNGTDMGNAVMQENIKIEANSTKEYSFPIKSDIETGKMGLSFLLGGLMKSRMTLRVEGKVKAGAFLISQQFPVEWEDEISF